VNGVPERPDLRLKLVIDRILKSLADQSENVKSATVRDKIRISVSYPTILRNIDEAHGLLVKIEKSLYVNRHAAPIKKLRLHDH